MIKNEYIGRTKRAVMTNQDYKNAALAAMKGKWAPAVLATVVIFLLMLPYLAVAEYPVLSGMNTNPAALPSWYLPVSLIGWVYMLLVVTPVEVGYANACKLLRQTGDDRLTANSFRIGFSRWLRHFWGIFLMGLKVMLWTFVFIIPGFVKAFAYALTPFLLVDCPELSPLKCIKLSNEMMKGHKFDLFYLYLSFIGWGILCVLTLGIGLLWLIPYMETSFAAFYQDVKEQYLAQHGIQTANDQTN